MSSTRIFHNISRIPVTSTLVLIFGNYELYRIHKGTHPYWSPILEEKGIVRRRVQNTSESTGGQSAPVVESQREGRKTSIQWLNLNGVPIPFITGRSV
ncbi:hypothetical protein COCMIDRAFT_81278 [Bipolaris oryzae ATCC 44560]|uniref:Uncharacterized protein n=1 Tax=Bipolaris oryzae ATCC 44560 TaxID=930090 RepID=W6ZT81_COCMI|nr:uncharacterized protein COCMIDRAFT_81278 [Bipolaris oryzae ATCC 44560]EUC50719.1 hypothetical protein COCMIDRAFT_81278 [Bipolaris oryzae ATCC 44560]